VFFSPRSTVVIRNFPAIRADKQPSVRRHRRPRLSPTRVCICMTFSELQTARDASAARETAKSCDLVWPANQVLLSPRFSLFFVHRVTFALVTLSCPEREHDKQMENGTSASVFTALNHRWTACLLLSGARDSFRVFVKMRVQVYRVECLHRIMFRALILCQVFHSGITYNLKGLNFHVSLSLCLSLSLFS